MVAHTTCRQSVIDVKQGVLGWSRFFRNGVACVKATFGEDGRVSGPCVQGSNYFQAASSKVHKGGNHAANDHELLTRPCSSSPPKKSGLINHGGGGVDEPSHWQSPARELASGAGRGRTALWRTVLHSLSRLAAPEPPSYFSFFLRK